MGMCISNKKTQKFNQYQEQTLVKELYLTKQENSQIIKDPEPNQINDQKNDKIANSQVLIQIDQNGQKNKNSQNLENPYQNELVQTAQCLIRRGYGILSADETPSSLGKQFSCLGIPNEAENRRKYHQMLFKTNGIQRFISGVIIDNETVNQSTDENQNFVDFLRTKGIVVGIKVDKGLQLLPGSKEETLTVGLDDLDVRCKEYYRKGIKFAKWRALQKIDKSQNYPSKLSLQNNAQELAKYACICQSNGLCPIIESEILTDGNHSIDLCQKTTEIVIQTIFKALIDHNVFLKGMLLKTNMVTCGAQFPDKSKINAEEIGLKTMQAYSRSVMQSVPGILILSGGMSEEEASINLNAINRIQNVKIPFNISFCFGRALSRNAVKIWAGKEKNCLIAQQKLLERAKANSEALLGKYCLFDEDKY